MSFIKKVKSYFHLIGQALSGSEQEFTSGSIDRAIVLLSIPMVLEMGMEAVFAVVDIYFVGMLHDNDAISTIGNTESVLAIVYSLAMGVSMGATAMIARRVGEKNFSAAADAAMQAIYIGVTLSLLISVGGLIYAESILRMMGSSEQLIENNVGFTRWMLGGNLSIMMLFIINAIFRGAGNASVAMWSLVIANALNIILDPIFIFGWGPIPAFGVVGAGIATTVGRTAGVLFQVYFLINGKGVIKILRENMAVRFEMIVRLLKVSAGSTGQFLIGSASWIFLMRIMSDFGSDAQAGYVIAIRVIVFAILPAWGMANAAATLVGQNLGAGQPDRAEKSAWRAGLFNMIFLGIVTIIFFTLAEPILRMFTTDPVALKNGAQCLQIVSMGYIFYAYSMVINQSFNGAGDTRTPTIISFFGFWVFQIPLAYALANWFETGPVGVYAAIAIAESLMALVGVYIFRMGKWKTVKI